MHQKCGYTARVRLGKIETSVDPTKPYNVIEVRTSPRDGKAGSCPTYAFFVWTRRLERIEVGNYYLAKRASKIKLLTVRVGNID